jgi:AcrR family transcriptional regulator
MNGASQLAKAGRPKEPWKRSHIIQSAIPLFRENGLWSVGVQELADAAGVSRASIHYHFSGVNGVILGVAEQGFQLMYTLRRSAVDKLGDPRSKLVALIRMGIPEILPPEYIVMYESIGVFRANPDSLPLLQGLSAKQLELYVSVIKEGVDAGFFFPREQIESIGKNLLSIEDAWGIYLTLGTEQNSEETRQRMLSYASLALKCDLSKFSRDAVADRPAATGLAS